MKTVKNHKKPSSHWSTPKFRGKVFAIVGDFAYPDRKELATGITQEGGNLAASVTDQIDFLVVSTGDIGDVRKRTRRAREKAKQLNKGGAAIKIIDVPAFKKLFTPSSQETLAMLTNGPKGLDRWKMLRDHYWLRAKVDLQGVNLRRAKLSGVRFDDFILDGADLREAHLDNASLPVPLSKVNFDGALMIHVGLGDLRDCSLRGADLSNASLRNAERSDFTGANLTESFLRQFRYRNVVFKKANLSKANLSAAHFQGNDFSEANLWGADLEGADLSKAKLKGANLAGAILGAARLALTDLTGADLTGAMLAGADLRGANLKSANLTEANLDAAKFDANTILPKGFDLEDRMRWMGPRRAKTTSAGATPIDPVSLFLKRLQKSIDPGRLAKALKMLKADRFQLFTDVKADSLVGVVKSQTDKDLVYSCRLAADGSFGCGTQNLKPCGGLQGSLCKHLLVLIVGLAKAGQLDPAKADAWVQASRSMKPALDKEQMSETFLRYKGAEAGEVDWRPTETIPEDYYAL